MAWREHAASLLSLANHHGVSAVKLSSMKQAKDILLSVEPTYAAELFPYLVELQHSPEPIVRRIILEIIEEVSWKSMEHLPILMPVIVDYLRDMDHRIVKQCIVIGTSLYKNVLAEMSIQLQRRGKVDWWAEELWKWLRRFRDTVLELALQSGATGVKILSLKFLELNVLLFTAEPNELSKSIIEGNGQVFNISWLPQSHSMLNPTMLKSDSIKFLGVLLNFLQPSAVFPGPIIISVVNSLAAIARKRPVHYGTILSALVDCISSFDKTKRWHASSVQYSLRTAFLGFLRSTFPDILETREKLHRALRMLNAGEAADQVIRQVDKMIRINERSSRERIAKDPSRKRYASINEEQDSSQENPAKRVRYPHSKIAKVNGSEKEMTSLNGPSLCVPVLDSDLTPAEKMIAMIGALLAEGERGAESLELLVSTFHPDLLADIVIINMNHLPKVHTPVTIPENVSVSNQLSIAQTSPTLKKPQLSSPIDKGTFVFLSSDITLTNNLSAETKRDPRRDPRRLDPRRLHSSSGTTTEPSICDVASATVLKSCFESNKTISFVDSSKDSLVTSVTVQSGFEGVGSNGEKKYTVSNLGNGSSHLHCGSEKDVVSIGRVLDSETSAANVDCDEPPLSPSSSYTSAPEDADQGFPETPQYVEMSEELQKSVANLAIERMIDSYIYLHGNSCNRIRLTLLSRFIALNNADDDIVKILQNHVASDNGPKKGHDLVLNVLYQLYSLMVEESVEVSDAAVVYEKLLLAAAKSLLDVFPATDKSFSRLLNEVPFFPESVFTLLDSLCCSDVVDNAQGRQILDSERVTQGLGAVWGLIVGRPNSRKTCLNIALKCASHSQDDIRAKAIRLVVNKLHQLDYITDIIEEFATSLLLKVVHQNVSEVELLQDQRIREDYSQLSEAKSETNCVAFISLSEAQRHVSLYFALCMKKPLLLRQIFNVYGCCPKTVKQVIHRHVSIVVRSLGSSSELLHIIADPPDRCENLLMLVLQILTEDALPSKDLIETVKHWFKTNVKDVMILIPILSFLPKEEVLPVFPRLVNLEIDQFQMALAHILQGSASTGPALTPTEVLVAIHAINLERDGLPLKKITDACTTCFEQRTVFTQHVLEKALNQMVDQTPLPLLFMRTVIQAIDAFPSLVDFVMEILSKLVARQIWKMPKLWVGFLKCVSQTRPHSFPVLLKLPPQQLEIALNRHPNLKPPLASYASLQPSLPRSTSLVLGLGNDLPSDTTQH